VRHSIVFSAPATLRNPPGKQRRGPKTGCPLCSGLRTAGRGAVTPSSQGVRERGRGVPTALLLLPQPDSAPRRGRSPRAGCGVALALQRRSRFSWKPPQRGRREPGRVPLPVPSAGPVPSRRSSLLQTNKPGREGLL